MVTTKILNRFIIPMFLFSIILTSCAKIEKKWDKSYGGSDDDELRTVISTSDGYLLCGYSKSPQMQDATQGGKTAIFRGGYDYWIVKTDKNGNYQWDKSYGGSGDDYLTCAVQTSDGFILGGYSNSPATIGEGAKTNDSRGGNDFWIVKIDNSGRVIFDRTFGGDGDDKMTSLLKSHNNTCFLGGISNSAINNDKTAKNFGGYDFWVIRIEQNGNYLWDRTFGGSGDDILVNIVERYDSPVYLTGTSTSGKNPEGFKNTVNIGAKDYWILRFLQYGNEIRDNMDYNWGGSGADDLNAFFPGVITQSPVNFVAAGSTISGVGGNRIQNSFGGWDFWIISEDGLLNKTFGGTGNDILHDMQIHGVGYLFGGESFSGKSGNKSENSFGGSDFWLIKTDGTMNVFSDKTFGGSSDDVLYSIKGKTNSNTDTEFILGGTSRSPVSGNKQATPFGGKDFWIVNVSITN